MFITEQFRLRCSSSWMRWTVREERIHNLPVRKKNSLSTLIRSRWQDKAHKIGPPKRSMSRGVVVKMVQRP
jgi:hypothetical protein